ncbi:MAG: DNA repair protein RadA [Ignavibacteria bacterium]|nr:DNA repair protein RadA [Ignavibacteria bacterium]
MKSRSNYVCQSCGAVSSGWAGRCHVCGTWESIVEEVSERGTTKKSSAKAAAGIITLGEVDTQSTQRIQTGINELDRVLGGGITPGSLILVGGDPGIGKSTLMLQMCAYLESSQPLYITGEESLHQIKQRAGRLLGIPDSLRLMAETGIDTILSAITTSRAKVVIVDSIQTVHSDLIESTAGSVSQVRECAAMLMKAAKKSGTAIFVVGHVTKEGMIAGPKVLEHMVDTVLQFEGEKTYSYRILRAIKNRYGSTNEIGIFEMAEEGLREVPNPSEIFLAERNQQDSGTAIISTIEGTRPLLLEVQALVTPTNYNVPQRTPTGFDLRRLQMILAVLEKRLGLKFGEYDVFVNVAGGVSLDDPGVDLGVAAALVSSLRDNPLDSSMVIIGEVGLTGEVRPVSAIEQRVAEIQKLGFASVMLPKSNALKLPKGFEVKLVPVERISLALAQLIA